MDTKSTLIGLICDVLVSDWLVKFPPSAKIFRVETHTAKRFLRIIIANVSLANSISCTIKILLFIQV